MYNCQTSYQSFVPAPNNSPRRKAQEKQCKKNGGDGCPCSPKIKYCPLMLSKAFKSLNKRLLEEVGTEAGHAL